MNLPNPSMASYQLKLIFLLLNLPFSFRHRSGATAAPLATEFLYPNFNISITNYIEKGGIFLTSISSTFSAKLSSQSPQSIFVFSIIHNPTATLVWSVNRLIPAPYTAVLSLSTAGLSISLANGSIIWSTPVLSGHAAALQLLDSSNLVLLDDANISLWQSFDHPTDTLLSSQRLLVGNSLSTTDGNYRLLVNVEDAVLLWLNEDQQYWRMSTDPLSVKNLNDHVAYMTANESGLYLFSAGGRAVYFINLPMTTLKFIKIEPNGQLFARGYSGDGSVLTKELAAPSGACDLPLSCGKLAVCSEGSVGATCNCPVSFPAMRNGGCSAGNGFTLASTSTCWDNNINNQSEATYLSIGNQVDYFANKFASPAIAGGSFASCRSLCTMNCSCLGFLYRNSSKACFLIKNQMGSLVNNSNNEGYIYIKIITSTQLQHFSNKNSNLIPILLPSMACILFLIILFAGIYCHRRLKKKAAPLKDIYLGRNNNLITQHRNNNISTEDISNSNNSEETSIEISIPYLPHRFTYAQLVTATNNFSAKIGSGGFGEVFRGELPDKTVVAVKRISIGMAGSINLKNVFCTEIAVIGRIHHVNLVRLRGFCAERRHRRLLVYDYMNRGSLDRSLFRAAGPVLEWQERMDIAIGAARGLAYLHSGCDRKIVHCDVKPENILLHDAGGVKISDFGLVRLISPDQSALFTTMRGTRGYLAPEWLANSAISDRADVYSYGMVLLEIIRGRKNWSATGEVEARYFPVQAMEMHEKGRYLELADPRLGTRVREEEVGRAVRVALCCVHEEPALRPSMEAVAAMLDGSMEVPRPRPEALAFLRLICGRGVGGYGIAGGNMTGESGDGTVSWPEGVVSHSNRSRGRRKEFGSVW